MSTLTINLNEEYRIKIENGNDFHNSIFKEVYINVAKNIVEIITQSEKNTEYDDFNNLIAFTGERGKGKSSSMISFRNALLDNKGSKHRNFFEAKNQNNESLKSSFEIIRNRKFAEIDIIDPSLFKGPERLLEIILAKMFSKFQIVVKETKSNITDDVRRNMISLFQSVFENLQIINSDRKELYKLETIEALSKLATSSNLRDCFKDLVSYYLENFEKKDFLLVAIDDFDLNVSGAYEMLEDIRQFLIQNRIIILVACKVEQLIEALVLHYDKLSLNDDKKNKANRYLDKLLPFNRRSSLPNIDSLGNIQLKILDDEIIIFDNSKINIVEGLSNILYNNYSLLISNVLIRTNSIFPKTIRETQYLFNILYNYKDFDLLRKFVIDETYKRDIYHEVFLDLDNCNDALLNLLLIKKINEQLRIILTNSTRNHNIRTNLETSKLSLSNVPENISIGDVLNCISELENLVEIDNFKGLRFIDLLKFYYIVRLKCIDENLYNLEFLKFGFYNGKIKILSEELGTKSRDFVKFNNQIICDNLNNNERFVVSMLLYSLGDSENYRNDIDKELFIHGYKKGILSPFSIFNNIKNLDILSDILSFNMEDEFVKNNISWFYNSKLIQQLCNPYFTIELYSELNKFRRREIKESLPKNYFDVLCLLFIYGTLNSLRNMELKYSYLDKFSYEFAKHPIVIELLNNFNKTPENLKYKKVKELNEIYFNEVQLNKNELLTTNFVETINNLYNDSGESIEVNNNQFNTKIIEKLKLLLKRINNNPNYKVQTLSTIINEIKQIDEFNPIIEDISLFKKGISSSDENLVISNKKQLKEFLLNLLNGQSS